MQKAGWIEVVCGPMFSGKTEELIRRLKLAKIAKQRVQIFKPKLDNRYDEKSITSHENQKTPCVAVESTGQILAELNDHTRIVGIDEAQFFDPSIVEICQKLANRGLRVIVAGLDQDYLGKPFGPMPELLAIAESILKLKAVCMSCGGEATRTQRLIETNEQIVVGSGEVYEARCRTCHDPDLSLAHSIPAKPLSRPTVKVVEQVTAKLSS